MDSNERKKIYAALAAPFPESAIERTDGRTTGRGYDTTGIKYQFIVNRLNEVLGVGGYRVQRTITMKEVATAKGRPAFEAICEIKLELGEWVGGEFLAFAEALGDGGHTSTSEADARKGSFTNAIKKAAAFHGVGKQAYEGTLDDDNVPVGEVVAQPVTPSIDKGVQSVARVPGQQVAPVRARLTQKQLGALLGICRSRGWDDKTFRERIKNRYGCTMDYLTRAQASELIGELGGNGKGDDRQPGQEG